MIQSAWAAVTAVPGSMDWNAFWSSLFAAIPPTLMALGAWVQVARNRNLAKKEREKESKEVKEALDREAEIVKRAADQVRESLRVTTEHTDERLSNLKDVTNDTHTLVNSNMGRVLALAAISTRRVAEITKDPQDIAIADEAEQARLAHEEQQKKVDEKAGEKEIAKSVVQSARKVGTIGEAVGEIGTDVKEVKEDVKDLKEIKDALDRNRKE